jgi:hypothetical protein
MSSNFYPKVREHLLKAGCYFVRYGKGDHEIWHSPINNRRFTVPSKIVKRPTANGALKDAGLPKKL